MKRRVAQTDKIAFNTCWERWFLVCWSITVCSSLFNGILLNSLFSISIDIQKKTLYSEPGNGPCYQYVYSMCNYLFSFYFGFCHPFFFYFPYLVCKNFKLTLFLKIRFKHIKNPSLVLASIVSADQIYWWKFILQKDWKWTFVRQMFCQIYRKLRPNKT